MPEAVICNLKRFAVHDGPGIRTTLFLKGCPLHCLWCHNPESIHPEPELAFHAHKCTGCGDCAAVCSHHRISSDGRHVFDRAACSACGKCAEVCLQGAPFLYGQRRTASDLATEILEDREFFQTSGGGVTVSGGEPLLQADFCAELFLLLKQENVHTAVDTCCCVPWHAFETVLPLTDLFLCDFKHADSGKHRELTGCGNEMIRENLLRLAALGKPMEVRIPLVPGANDDDENLERSGEFLSGITSLTCVRLLPYHAFARSKYLALGRSDTMPQVDPPSPERMHRAAKILASHRLKVAGVDSRSRTN